MAKRTCSINGCDNQHRARGLCTAHYKRWRRHGDPLAGRTLDGEPAKWLEAHLAAPPTDACIEWPYTRVPSGYGQMHLDGRMHPVTHVVLERTGRPRPPAPDDFALHSCHNPPCCNPAHLRWGSTDENMIDMIKAGRAAHGISNANAKLTDDDVRAIRARYAAGGVSQPKLADEYGIHDSTVSAIVRRETWRHVLPDTIKD